VSADDPGAPSSVMKALGQRYVQYINRTYRRSGGLWEGRFRSCLVQQDDYLFACLRYIEMNPVRAGMVEQPADYRWSSYRARSTRCSRLMPRISPWVRIRTKDSSAIACCSANSGASRYWRTFATHERQFRTG
jgi:hypothetical protein